MGTYGTEMNDNEEEEDEEKDDAEGTIRFIYVDAAGRVLRDEENDAEDDAEDNAEDNVEEEEDGDVRNRV